MFAASILAKGGGLIVTILVARYLGASSLGVYAVVLAVALLLEVMSPLGHQEVIIRAIARDRSQMLVHWVNASASTLLASVCAICVRWVNVLGKPCYEDHETQQDTRPARLQAARLPLHKTGRRGAGPIAATVYDR